LRERSKKRPGKRWVYCHEVATLGGTLKKVLKRQNGLILNRAGGPAGGGGLWLTNDRKTTRSMPAKMDYIQKVARGKLKEEHGTASSLLKVKTDSSMGKKTKAREKKNLIPNLGKASKEILDGRALPADNSAL